MHPRHESSHGSAAPGHADKPSVARPGPTPASGWTRAWPWRFAATGPVAAGGWQIITEDDEQQSMQRSSYSSMPAPAANGTPSGTLSNVNHNSVDYTGRYSVSVERPRSEAAPRMLSQLDRQTSRAAGPFVAGRLVHRAERPREDKLTNRQSNQATCGGRLSYAVACHVCPAAWHPGVDAPSGRLSLSAGLLPASGIAKPGDRSALINATYQYRSDRSSDRSRRSHAPL